MALGSFSASIEAFRKKANERAHTTVRRVVIGLGSKIIERTPVGTPETTGITGYIGGRAKANWQYGLDQPPAGVLEEFDDDRRGRETIAKLAAAIPSRTGAAGRVHYIVNNVHYITYLEDGSSQQAREGMVARTVLEFPQIVKESSK